MANTMPLSLIFMLYFDFSLGARAGSMKSMHIIDIIHARMHMSDLLCLKNIPKVTFFYSVLLATTELKAS